VAPLQVRLGHALAQTRVVPESLEPDWNETFAFGEAEVGAAIAAGGRLVFEVWDRDYATLDDFMGQARGARRGGAGGGGALSALAAVSPQGVMVVLKRGSTVVYIRKALKWGNLRQM